MSGERTRHEKAKARVHNELGLFCNGELNIKGQARGHVPTFSDGHLLEPICLLTADFGVECEDRQGGMSLRGMRLARTRTRREKVKARVHDLGLFCNGELNIQGQARGHVPTNNGTGHGATRHRFSFY